MAKCHQSQFHLASRYECLRGKALEFHCLFIYDSSTVLTPLFVFPLIALSYEAGGESQKSMASSKNIRSIYISFLLFGLLVSCTSASRLPIEITEARSSHEPIVGRLVDLQLKIRSIKDEPKVLVTLNLPSTIYTPNVQNQWEINLQENQPVTVSTSICVLETGSWAIRVGISSLYEDGELKYGDREVIGIISSEDSGRILLEEEITFSPEQETREAAASTLRIDPSDCSKP